MSNEHNTNVGTNASFPPESAPPSNPFGGDMKGEFTSEFGPKSDFGTNTTVSAIFKDDDMASQNRMKIIVAVGVLALLVGGALLMMPSAEPEYVFPEETPVATNETAPTDDALVAEDDAVTEDAAVAEDTVVEEEVVDDASALDESAVAPTGSVALVSPENGSGRAYDETSGAAEFSWEGEAAYIVFSRSASMVPESRRVRVSGNSYRFQHPYPGTWYWRVENAEGGSEVRSFSVTAPDPRALALSQPAPGEAVSGNGGVVSWAEADRVAFYRIEISNSGWANPSHRFATRGTSLSVQGVAPGEYEMRLGAFSEVSGRWEYTSPQPITIQ